MKKIIFSLVVFLLSAISLKGASPETYRLVVGDFGELQVVDGINVIHRCNPDSAGLAVFTCPPRAVSHLMFTNNKNKLKIQINNDDQSALDIVPTITIYSNYIVSVENSGDSTLIVESPAPGASFKARIVGNGTLIVNNIHSTKAEGKLDTGKGHLVMSGKARTADFRSVGTGHIDAAELEAESGSITILGTGPVDCQISKELSVKGMGSGKVFVKGTPKVKNRSLGTIKVINIDAPAE